MQHITQMRTLSSLGLKKKSSLRSEIPRKKSRRLLDWEICCNSGNFRVLVKLSDIYRTLSPQRLLVFFWHHKASRHHFENSSRVLIILTRTLAWHFATLHLDGLLTDVHSELIWGNLFTGSVRNSLSSKKQWTSQAPVSLSTDKFFCIYTCHGENLYCVVHVCIEL